MIHIHSTVPESIDQDIAMSLVAVFTGIAVGVSVEAMDTTVQYRSVLCFVFRNVPTLHSACFAAFQLTMPTGRLAVLFERLGDIVRPVPTQRVGWTTPTGATLDHDVLEFIVAHLRGQDLAALGSTCSSLRALAACSYIGLRLTLFPHQRASLAFMMAAEASSQRGGILADEPGTGKTVTILSLLCKTAGLRSRAPADVEKARAAAADEEWTSLALPFKRELVYAILKDVRTRCPRGFALFGSSSGVQAAAELEGYLALVPSPPPDFAALKSDATIGAFPSRSAFDEAVRAVPQAALTYWSSDVAGHTHPQGPAAAAELASVAKELQDVLETVLKSCRPNGSNVGKASKSGDWSKLGKGGGPIALRSCATLLVVPRPLVPHWREQLEWHVHTGALGGPVIVDDHGPAELRDLYSAAELAAAAVVVTSSERLSQEQRHAHRSDGRPSVLCEVAWVRLICDEGHSLGGGAITHTKVLLIASRSPLDCLLIAS